MLKTVLVYGTLLVCAASAFAGKYQRTLDKKSHIWNDDPKPGEECNWSGKRDRLDLADGPGTLTWYNDEKGPRTRTNFSTERLHFASKLTGTMLRGRWEGIVEAMDANGHVSHALFDNGKLMTAWSEGAAPAQAKLAAAAVTERKEESKPAAAALPASSAISRTTPEPVAKLPSQPTPPISKAPADFSIEPKPLVQNSSPAAIRSTPVPTKAMLNTPQSPVRSGGSLLSDPVVASSASGGDAGDLFHSLSAPPTLLQHRATLTPREASKIAEAELAREGLKLADYPRRQLTYDPDADRWIVSYEHGAGNESASGPAKLGVSVDDKSGNATLLH